MQAEDLVVGEPRWPSASAILAAIVLTILMPDDLRLGPNWLLPVIVGVLLVAHIAADPGRIDRRTATLRALSIALISVLVFSALWAAVLLTSHLINGGEETNSAGALLAAGSTVWASNIIAFALLYWELDGGGPAERAHLPSSRIVDFAFPQQMSPELAPANWRPRFIDYLYLGFTNATAFSPTLTHAALKIFTAFYVLTGIGILVELARELGVGYVKEREERHAARHARHHKEDPPEAQSAG